MDFSYPTALGRTKAFRPQKDKNSAVSIARRIIKSCDGCDVDRHALCAAA